MFRFLRNRQQSVRLERDKKKNAHMIYINERDKETDSYNEEIKTETFNIKNKTTIFDQFYFLGERLLLLSITINKNQWKHRIEITCYHVLTDGSIITMVFDKDLFLNVIDNQDKHMPMTKPIC